MRSIPSSLLVLPDTEQAARLVEKRCPRDAHRIAHPSGRPWIVLDLPAFVNRVSSSDHSVVVIGTTSATTLDLDRHLAAMRRIDDLSSIQRTYDGSFVVLGTRPEGLYASAPALETRRLVSTTIDGVPVIADRADALATLDDRGLDHETVLLHLCRGLPHPLNTASIWDGISVLPGDRYWIVENGARLRTGRWWSRPDPVLNRAEGAERLREALAASVAVRITDRDTLACDLSGGLDSTPLCFFAAQMSDRLVARTFYTEDPGGCEDLTWARRALPAMPQIAEHQIFSTAGIPGFYEGLGDLDVVMDEPTQAAGTIPRVRLMLADDVEQGIDLHLNGLGGDHLFRGVRVWNHTLFRSRPLLAWSRARAEDIPRGVPAWTTARQLADRRGYSRWLADMTRDAAQGIEPPELPRCSDWSVPLSMPNWLSRRGRDSVLDRMHSAARTAEPLADDLAGHFDLLSVRQAGRLARSMGQIGDHQNVAYDSPMLDDRVVEAALAVRYEERDTPVEWKPLIKEAMRGLLPEEYLRRTNKIGGSPQAVRGYAANYDALQQLWQESGLLDTGLIDVRTLQKESAPSATAAPSTYLHALTDTAIVLRSQQSQSVQNPRHEQEAS